MRKLLFVLMCLSFSVFISCDRPQSTPESTDQNDKPVVEDTNVTFETLGQGTNSGHNEKKDYVVSSEQEWSELWVKVHATFDPKPELPKINFNDSVVIAVFKGAQSGGGHSIAVESITNTQDGWNVKVKEVSPEPGGMMSMGFTQPYHIVKSKKTDKKVNFVRE